jgi:hypothetical protein
VRLARRPLCFVFATGSVSMRSLPFFFHNHSIPSSLPCISFVSARPYLTAPPTSQMLQFKLLWLVLPLLPMQSTPSRQRSSLLHLLSNPRSLQNPIMKRTRLISLVKLRRSRPLMLHLLSALFDQSCVFVLQLPLRQLLTKSLASWLKFRSCPDPESSSILWLSC